MTRQHIKRPFKIYFVKIESRNKNKKEDVSYLN